MIHITISEDYSLESQELLKLKLKANIHLIPNETLQTLKDNAAQAEDFKKSQILLTRSRTFVDSQLLQKAPQLQVLGTATSGLNHIDQELCRERGIQIFDAREANTQSAAEHSLMLILNLLKKFNAAQKAIRAAQWKTHLSRGSELHGKSLGIIGLGRIGTRVAQLTQAFGAEIFAYDPYVSRKHFDKHNVTPMGFTEILKQSDILTLHVPLTHETENMINRQSLSLLNESCLLINTSRGAVLNENDLLQSLSLKKLGGAALDVYKKEPFLPNPKWIKTPNLLLSPHIGAFTQEAFQRASHTVVQQVIDFMNHNK